MRTLLVSLILLLSPMVTVQAHAEETTQTSGHQGYVNNKTCAACHQSEARAWQGSDHAHAMQEANSESVLGDFNNTKFNYFGESTRFTHKDGRYYIDTIGKDGKSHHYQVKYTFGYFPLQQYLLDVGKGQLQAFTIAWDTKNKRWFHLYPDKYISATNPLHWSKRFFNWNHNCASCHSTHFEKKFNPKTKIYHSDWAQISVGCQSCHGPGKAHLEWAKGDKKEKDMGLSSAHFQGKSKSLIGMCASCHARRHRIAIDDNYDTPFYDKYMPELLRQGLYHPDGQIEDEVFVLGSFMQSKMYQRGVTCINCHNPHSLKPRFPGNKLCLQCHNQNPVKAYQGLKTKNYDSPSHTHHKQGSPGSQCVNCHMPQKIYMQKDKRFDHSFRIPRPDLSIQIGTPNACNQCHQDKSPQWALKHIQEWTGKKSFAKHYGQTFAQARKHDPKALSELIRLSKDKTRPMIVRATAIELLATYPEQASINTRLQALSASSPLLRTAAVSSLEPLNIDQKLNALPPLLVDSNRAVRIEAARLLNQVPKDRLPQASKKAYHKALKEYKQLQKRNLDMPDAHYNLALLAQHQGNIDKAIGNYQKALKLDKSFYPASQNLARLFHAQGSKSAAIDTLKSSIDNNKDQGELYYSLGLLFAEQNDWPKAAPMLEKASVLLPSQSRIQYNYGLALMNLGDLNKATDVLSKAHKLDSNSADILYALVLNYVRLKAWSEALPYAETLRSQWPEQTQYQRLLRYIRFQQSQQ